MNFKNELEQKCLNWFLMQIVHKIVLNRTICKNALSFLCDRFQKSKYYLMEKPFNEMLLCEASITYKLCVCLFMYIFIFLSLILRYAKCCP
jgi:hypothetical protein